MKMFLSNLEVRESRNKEMEVLSDRRLTVIMALQESSENSEFKKLGRESSDCLVMQIILKKRKKHLSFCVNHLSFGRKVVFVFLVFSFEEATRACLIIWLVRK